MPSGPRSATPVSMRLVALDDKECLDAQRFSHCGDGDFIAARQSDKSHFHWHLPAQLP
jgi:hypothetical protein